MTVNGEVLLDDELRRCLVVSVVFHICSVLLLYFGLPSLFKPPPGMLHPLVPINIVDIGEITNTRIRDDKSEEETKPPAPQPVKPPQQEEQKPPPTPEPPQPKAAEAEAEALSAPKPMQKPKPPEPPKQETKQQQDQLTSLLKNVAKMKQESPQSDSKVQSDAKETASSSGKGLALGDRLTISEEDALRRQISQCWNMPVGAKEAENLVVEVLIDVNPDRTVRSARVVDELRMASDSYFRSAAESALRALRNPKCSPLELNPDKYEQWKTIRFNFDPRDML